jgi:predicted nucleic acid-binding Zn ribbon protein
MLQAHVRVIETQDGDAVVLDLSQPLAGRGEPACPECGGNIKTRKAARWCSARCRAAASRRRRTAAQVEKLVAAEVALRAALGVVRELREDLGTRGAK